MKLALPYILTIIFVIFTQLGFGQNKQRWHIGLPLFEKGEAGDFDEISVKDPTLVFYKNKWHLFYTARSETEYTTGYVSAKDLEDLNFTPRYELKQIRGKTRYGCAPQVFYFEPQELWYLVFQNRDANYQPAFTTTADISDPDSWSEAKKLIEKDTSQNWIDFWVIADKQKVYLFYTEGHNGVMVRSTTLKNFPNGWGKSKKVFENVHEAVHIYKVEGKNEFHMIYELNKIGVRSFGLAKANHPEGKWGKVTDEYASGNQLKWMNDSNPWTEMVSHGEVIRSGYDQFMEYEPARCRWIIQGLMKKDLNVKYKMLPWKLGIIQQTID